MTDLETLAHPEWSLPLGLIVAACAVALGWAFFRGERALLRWVGTAPGRRDRLLRDVLLLMAIAALAIALIGPRFGTRELRIPATGLDLVMLMDVSRSMTSGDNPPSRMARSRQIATGVLERLGEGDRAALAIFAGQGELVTPFTSDKSALAEMLPALDPTLFSDASSNGKAGVRAALPAFSTSGPRPRLLLVLSDGEIGRLPGVLASEVAQADARVVAVLLGTETGGPIPDRGRPLRGAKGKPVHTRRVLSDLAPLIEASGGRLFLADGWGEVDLPALVAEIRRDAIPTAEGTLLRRVPITWVAPPAFLVWLLLLLEAWPGTFRTKRAAVEPMARFPGRRWASLARALPWLVLATFLPGAAEPQPDPRPVLEAQIRAAGADSRVLVALGIARARAGEIAEAEHAFRAAALRGGDSRTAALAWYDLGVLALEGGRLEEARHAFFESLALDAGSHKAKFNLEWTLTALRKEEQVPPENQPHETDPTSPPEAEEAQDTDDGDEAQPDEAREERAARTPEETRPPENSPQEPVSRRSRDEPQPPSMDQAEAERWLDAQEDDVRAALDAQLGSSGGPWVGGSRW
ncbi:MAG: VWA domain-containing protein [bacterium]|nr:VWA domain-containing protein [bacterium]